MVATCAPEYKESVNGRWEHFSHEADIGVRGRGASVEEAFSQAALALTGAVTDPKDVAPRTAVGIECHAPDRELLLADWLNALVFEMATRRMLFSRFDVRITERDGGDAPAFDLQATAWGEPIERQRHRPAVEVKGATYTELKVAEDARGGWLAQCVIDV
jgi:tRNA nucleotidyltransferase (CCA-adding enzyme)